MVSAMRSIGKVPSENADDGQCKRKATRNVKTNNANYNLCGHCARGFKNFKGAVITKL